MAPIVEPRRFRTKELSVASATIFNGLSLQAEMETADGHIFRCSFGTYHPETQRFKYIYAVSSLVGCPVRCRTICGVQGFARELSPEEICGQVLLLQNMAESARLNHEHDERKISFVKEGEPFLNKQFGRVLAALERFSLPIKVSTTFPDTANSHAAAESLLLFAGRYPRTVQLQVSLGSTDPAERKKLTAMATVPFDGIREFGERWSNGTYGRHHREINLSFTLYEETPCDPAEIYGILPPQHFAIRFRNALPGRATPLGRTPLSDGRYCDLRAAFEGRGYRVIDGRCGEVEAIHNLATGQYASIRKPE